MIEDRDKRVLIEDEIKDSYLTYSMSVIVSRALPDVRDGFKPVHRRIIYSMNENSLYHNKPHRKSAKVVGDVLGNYHPHGDQAIYMAMVRMGQDFNTRYLMIDGHGNYGSVDGDPPASIRYTETRMSKLASEMVEDIDKNTVPFKNTFDDQNQEPEVLPAKVPNLLLNGASGIAVGMATNIPPHNFGEVVDACLAYIDNFDITSLELMEHIKGPDFPTGAMIYGSEGLRSAYTTGKGRVKVRSKVRIRVNAKGGSSIIVDELPYQVNKANLVEQIANLVKDKKVEGITDLRDESDRKGLRIYIEVKRGENAEVILNKLYKYTNLEVTFGIIMLALDKNIPKVLNLKQVISLYTQHRFEVITNRTKFDLDKNERKLHLLKGFRIAITNIEEVVQIIKGSKDANDAKSQLIERFILSEDQTKAILEMRLQKLTSLEVEKLDNDILAVEEEIKRLKFILSDDKNIYQIIKEDLTEMKLKYSDKRRSEIIEDVSLITEEDMVKDSEVLVTITNKGYVKRLDVDTYRAQHRGGKGYMGQNLDEDDFLRSATYAKNLDTLLLFTNRGKVFSVRVYELPELSKNSKGRLFSNIVPLGIGEKIKAIIKTRDLVSSKSLVFVTKQGIVKKTELSLYKNINKSGIIAIKLRKGDDLVNTFLVNDEYNIFLATKNGYSLRFNAAEVRSVGRSSIGVKGISLRDGDHIVSGLGVPNEDANVMTISEEAYGKKSKISGYTLISRGRKGVINMKISPKTGDVVSVQEVKKDDEIVLITSKGSVIRVSVNDISTIGRATQGVRIMKLRKGEKVVDTAKIRI